MRTRPGVEECATLLQEVRPSVVIGNVGPGESGGNIVQAVLRSGARNFLLECTPQLPNSTLWYTNMQPMLDESYPTDKVELKASSVGVPSGRKQTFVTATATTGTPRAKEKIEAWKRGDGEGRQSQHVLRKRLRPQRSILPEEGHRPKSCIFVRIPYSLRNQGPRYGRETSIRNVSGLLE